MLNCDLKFISFGFVCITCYAVDVIQMFILLSLADIAHGRDTTHTSQCTRTAAYTSFTSHSPQGVLTEITRKVHFHTLINQTAPSILITGPWFHNTVSASLLVTYISHTSITASSSLHELYHIRAPEEGEFQ